MKKSILMLSALCLLIAGSCKKSKKLDNQPAEVGKQPGCLLTESYSLNSKGDTTKLFYTHNAYGKISSVKEVTAGVVGSETFYTYSNLKVIEYQIQGSDAFLTVYTLDAQGRIVSGTSNGATTTYIYNADGYLTETNDDQIIKYSYTDGNLTALNFDGVASQNYTYSTELLKDNFHDAYSPTGSVLKNYFGKRSKNLISKYTYIDNGVIEGETTFSYEKDALGNITKTFAISSEGTYSTNWKYTCK